MHVSFKKSNFLKRYFTLQNESYFLDFKNLFTVTVYKFINIYFLNYN